MAFFFFLVGGDQLTAMQLCQAESLFPALSEKATRMRSAGSDGTAALAKMCSGPTAAGEQRPTAAQIAAPEVNAWFHRACLRVPPSHRYVSPT